MSDDKLLHNVSTYYTEKVKEYGATPRGVDWNSEESQYLRFDKISELLRDRTEFSILDFGCGTGAYLKYLSEKDVACSYTGFDISPEMIETAKKVNTNLNGEFRTDLTGQNFDYVIASGIFNVRLQFNLDQWETYVHNTIEKLNQLSTKGFAFNILTLYSDEEKRRGDLYYADPLRYFDLCKKKYSRFVTLLHDYPLYEFTLLVRKDL